MTQKELNQKIKGSQFETWFETCKSELYFDVSDEDKFREWHCKNEFHITTQFMYIIVLLLLNTIQAVRARHLPINFRETRVVVLANVLNMFSLTITPWLAVYTKTHRKRVIYFLSAALVYNGFSFLILYGYKVYIVLFLSHLNTRKNINSDVMYKMKKQARRICSKSQ